LNDKTSAAAIVHQSLLDATAAFFQSSLKPTANGNRPYQQTGKKQDPAAPIFSKRLKVEPRKKFQLAGSCTTTTLLLESS
jgi:hypothetical protein